MYSVIQLKIRERIRQEEYCLVTARYHHHHHHHILGIAFDSQSIEIIILKINRQHIVIDHGIKEFAELFKFSIE